MKSIKVRTQLLILTSVLMVGLIVIGITSLITFERIHTLNELAFEASEIENQMLKLRKHEKDFLAREVKDANYFESGKSKYGEKFEADHAIVEKDLGLLRASRYIQTHNLLPLIDSLDNSFIEYENVFLEITQNAYERGFKDWGLVGELRKSIKTIESDIQTMGLTDTYKVSMLMLRRHEKDYFLRKDTKYQEKFHEEITVFEDLVSSNADLSLNEKKVFIEHIENYKKKFDIVIEMDHEIGLSEKEGHMAEMRAAIHNVEPLIERLTHTLTQVVENTINRSTTILWILIFVIVAISLTFAYIISKGIYEQLGSEPANLAIIADTIAKGDLTIEIDKSSVGVLASMQEMASQLRDIMGKINGGADQIATASEETSSSSQQLSQGANEQAASIEEVSATMEQIASNIQNNANNANETENISNNAFEGIQNVNKASKESLNSIQDIAEKITIINDIALQTNILALNAAVEAARAGEHGKGFAVVAAEVRKLAERSKDAAKEIVELASSSVQATEQAAELMEKILPDIEKTSLLISEISAASAEQKNGTDQVNNAIQQLNSVTQQNSASSEELAGNSEELYSQAEGLRDMIKFFKI